MKDSAKENGSATTNERLVWLDLIRGVSAIAVCAWHLRIAIWVRREEIPNQGIGDAILYALTGMGHQSVMIFFVLSGFLVGGAILRPSFSWAHYAIARLSRLWTVLIPCLLFTFIIGFALGKDVTHAFSSTYDASLATLLGNTFFLQTIAVPVFGGNEPLWSLANEFWYYAAFPLLVSRRLFQTALGVFIVYLLPSEIKFGFLIWLLGVAAFMFTTHASERAQRAASRLFLGIITAFIAALLYSKSPAAQALLRIPADLLVGGSFALICVSLINRPPVLSGLARQISEMSYSLYLTHFPVVALIGAYFYPQKLVPTATTVVQFVGWLALLLVVGWLFWWFFERHTNRVRRLIFDLLPVGRH